jgi:hypothetical protein
MRHEGSPAPARRHRDHKLPALPEAAPRQLDVRTIGFLGPPPSAGGFVQAFQQGLRDLGYIEAQNIRIERRARQ